MHTWDKLRQYPIWTQGCVGAREMLFEMRMRRRKGKRDTQRGEARWQGEGLGEMQRLSRDIQDRIFSLSKEKNWCRDYLYPSKLSKFWRIRKVLLSLSAPRFFWFVFLSLSHDCWLTLSRTPGGVLEWTRLTQHTCRPLLPSGWVPPWPLALCPPVRLHTSARSMKGVLIVPI